MPGCEAAESRAPRARGARCGGADARWSSVRVSTSGESPLIHADDATVPGVRDGSGAKGRRFVGAVHNGCWCDREASRCDPMCDAEMPMAKQNRAHTVDVHALQAVHGGRVKSASVRRSG